MALNIVTASSGRQDLAERFAGYLRQALESRQVTTTRKIVVSAGPWRTYDVEVGFTNHGEIHIDFYSVIRIDGRLEAALNYAVECIKADKPL